MHLETGLTKLMTEAKIDRLTGVATPARDRHARRREQTRAKLVEAARTLFAGRGVDNTRINEITDEADVGFGSFYNHFDSKEAIVEAVLAETVAAQGEAIEAVTSQLEDPAEVIAAAHREFVRRARSDPDWGWLLVRLDVSHNVMLAAGAVEIVVPHSPDDEAVREVLSAYVWTWRLVGRN